MKSITTGADKLVQLIAEKKRISLDDASKILNVDKEVLREWAEFLEQEKHISIDYKFSKMWLEEKHVTKQEIVSAAKEVSSEKEAFERKIDAIIHNLNSDTIGFEKVKEEFNKVHEQIRKEVDAVKKESDDLERFNYLKQNIDKEIAKQKKDYEAQVKEYVESLIDEKEKFNSFKNELDKQYSKMDEIKKSMDELNAKRQEIHKTIDDGHVLLKNLDKELDVKKSDFKNMTKEIDSTKGFVDKVKKDIESLKSKKLDKLIEIVDERNAEIRKKIINAENEVNKKVENIKSRSKQGSDFYENFQGILKKKIKEQEMLDTIDKDKKSLKDELESLKKTIHEFSLLKKNAKIHMDINEMKKKIVSFEKRKEDLNSRINNFFGYIDRG